MASSLPETRDVLRAVARHGLILATGHLDRPDTFAVVDGALEEGVTDIVVTHPEFPRRLGKRPEPPSGHLRPSEGR